MSQRSAIWNFFEKIASLQYLPTTSCHSIQPDEILEFEILRSEKHFFATKKSLKFCFVKEDRDTPP